MFGTKHYIPILRWKAAEKEALLYLSPEVRKQITPLLELLMPQPKERKKKNGQSKTPEELLSESLQLLKEATPKVPSDIQKCWGITPAFIEVGLLDKSERAQVLSSILTEGTKLGLSLVPVVNLHSDPETMKGAIQLANEYGSGLCLRLFPSDIFRGASLAKEIDGFMKASSLVPEKVDLLLDFQITDDQYATLGNVAKNIPDILKWRTFTVASGAFPIDLSDFTVDLYNIPRSDWENWLSQINSKKLTRQPSFADYTIQHPIYREPVPGANPSASIRYTLNDEWMIMRGQGLRSPNGAGFKQYPALAQLLSQRPEYLSFGRDFSYGDQYIEKIGKSVMGKETGNPRTWLRAGINHHIACVVAQIASLP
jgi:hypothetical protein